MDVAAWINQLDADGPLFAAAAQRAGWDAPVPGTEWDIRTLVVHTGAVHRWATDAVQRSLATNETGGSKAFHGDAEDDERLDWFADGHAALVSTLRSAPPDLDAFTFLAAESPLHFWARRQAHETAIHRADAEAAGGGVAAFDADLAQDGIGELAGWGRSRAFAVDRAATLALQASDGPSWLITFGGERNVIVPGTDLDAADAIVSGTSSELYLWAWNRPSAARVSGDASAAALWSKVRIT